ncbi:Beta propeller domain protein [Micromonospora sp. MW-13]|uniref:beta-propeller domain-containing protein n=1 Tax=Micromonospora sp. MW-13 TaxID=2094022 RepID=UPI000E42ED1B|nr:beta-propeller domain-containing protein [Micromonospora sp. MW-13]RGC68714.1 Beta propeller domain protein [Micromonospora sp. MW-13]
MTRGHLTAAAGTLVALALLAGSAAALPHREPEPSPGPLRLVSFDTCAEALTRLRAAASASVGPWGFQPGWRSGMAPGGLAEPAMVPKTADGARAAGAAAEHSGTNNHEPGADEPDLVKTDGRRIVTVTGGVLRVVDPATRRATGQLDLTGGGRFGWSPDSLLLHGDRALVLARSAAVRPTPGLPGVRRPATAPPADVPAGPRLLLVDLAGRPTLTGTYRVDGSLLDARLTGPTARVVVRSQPRLGFPVLGEDATDAQRLAANRAVIARAGLDAWLPTYDWTEGGRSGDGQVGCDRLSATADSTGTVVLTVLSFDLAAGRLGDGDPVSVAGDADTVYGTAGSLYLAGQRQRPGQLRPRGWLGSGDPTTVIHQFDTGAPGRPRYLASGAVPGTLINQYALSEWQGHLRVATTSGDERGARPATESAVYVLTRRDGALTRIGAVSGLGRGERIHSVRYLGPTGYVVTFRRTDPLYSLDLTDPAAPRVTGELKITGYSAYLHPAGEGRLIGVGQEADTNGRVQGLQVSLFDVADPARPTRLAQYHLPRAGAAAEFDPHAFLYDPRTGLVALPVHDGSVLLLRVTDGTVTRAGAIAHPGRAPVARSVLVGSTLWTVSHAGLRASEPSGGTALAWLPAT